MTKNAVDDVFYALCVEFGRPVRAGLMATRMPVRVHGLADAHRLIRSLARPANLNDPLWRVDVMSALIRARPLSIPGEDAGLVNYVAAFLCGAFHPFALDMRECANCSTAVQADCRAKTPVDGNICLRLWVNERIAQYRRRRWDDTAMLGATLSDPPALRMLLAERLSEYKAMARRKGVKV